MRGWVIKFEGDRVTSWPIDDSARRDPSKDSIVENREASEGAGSVGRKIPVEKTGPRIIDIIFRDADAQPFITSHVARQVEVENKADPAPRRMQVDLIDDERVRADLGAAPKVKNIPIEGHVDIMTSWGASGWARFTDGRDEFVRIEVVLNGVVICEGLARDLRPSDRGSGYCGFTLQFDPQLSDGDKPEFFAIGAAGTLRLASADMVASEVAASLQGTSAAIVATTKTGSTPSHDIEGGVDIITRWYASGWVWRPSTPKQPLEVEATLNGKAIGRVTADQFRQDLGKYGKGNGHHGFVLNFSSPLEGETVPTLSVKEEGGSIVIPNHAKVIAGVKKPTTALKEKPASAPTLLLPAVEGHIDHLTRRGAKGWAWFPSAPELTVQIDAVLDGKIIGRALANQLRPDLAQHGKATGHYGFTIKFNEPVMGATAPRFQATQASCHFLTNECELPPDSRIDLVKRTSGSFSALLNEHAAFTTKGPLFEEFDETILTRIAESEGNWPRPMLVAFYLPQFHPIEENDYFWGKGFTEWRQLSKGMPRFPGHYQPHIPRDLGFYDLENIETLVKQVAMAKAGGVSSFAYYYYWFNRKRVLERPLELLLESDIDMPFMLIWANENWTRTWDGSESEILLEQDYHPDDEDALIDDIARHFSDRRYIRLNNRPLFVIYNPKNVPESAQTIGRWREKLTTRIGVEPLLFMAQTFGELDPRPHGLDGALEFPPHKLSNRLPGRPTPDAYSPEFAGRVIDYDDFANASLDENEPEDFPLIKTIVPNWDNDCRRPNRGLTLEGSAPHKYETWLTELLTRAMDAPVFGTPIVAVNAWNEWAESAYLEPDVHFGAAYLNATARAYVSAVDSRDASTQEVGSESARPPTVSVIFPNYNHEKFLPERLGSVLQQTMRPAEIIFLDDCSSDDSISVAKSILSQSGIPFRIVKNEMNSGCVFRQWMKGIDLARHDLIWIAETDDSADRHFLRNLLPAFERDDILAAFGRITCIDQEGAPRGDLDAYFDGLKNFSWRQSCVVPAHRAFSHDFTVKNVIPNASGLVFRKPILTKMERERLFEYRFAGDWYFYSLITRGGSIAYRRNARSFFRVNPSSASRSSFFTERHLAEHKMVVQDLWREYGVDDTAIDAHCQSLAHYLTDRSAESLSQSMRQALPREAGQHPMRVCIAANGFAVGGGEILPVELANTLKGLGVHVTYLAIERPNGLLDGQVRQRLRSDIPVVYWDSICDDLPGFIKQYGIQLINSHNVSVDFRVFLRKVDLEIPYVASLHGGYETVPELLTPDFLAYLSRYVTKWLYLAERNFAFLPDDLRKPGKFLHSFNAVPPLADVVDRESFRAQHGIGSDAFVFVQCSRAIESKGWAQAIEIVARIDAQGWPVHLVLIGDGPVAGELKEKYGKSPLVTFLGQIERPIRYFKCFDMGIFPTRFEGETFPLFLLECFEAGLPVATTDIGEIPRIMQGVLGQPPGLLVDHRSDPETLASEFVKKLKNMFGSVGAYDAYQAGAVTTSRRFSMAVLGDLYLKSFGDLFEPMAESGPVASKRRKQGSKAARTGK
ncbi:glycoside hydrolase family 99-like domain-containing protein [Rhodoblastus sp.]|uniref:glycoside hydrolase family 99-like domain-containing protein n=1 Tax=Rhodoblastus sp. TaxID=1962975 RepID=UPI0025DAFA9F|nr:glycoside hydrolase family 99-like domain-containing protein [Rhodoblastus sp.]